MKAELANLGAFVSGACPKCGTQNSMFFDFAGTDEAPAIPVQAWLQCDNGDCNHSIPIALGSEVASVSGALAQGVVVRQHQRYEQPTDRLPQSSDGARKTTQQEQ